MVRFLEYCEGAFCGSNMNASYIGSYRTMPRKENICEVLRRFALADMEPRENRNAARVKPRRKIFSGASAMFPSSKLRMR